MLDCAASDVAAMSKADLLMSLRASEGRVMVCETVTAVEPLLAGVTNAELVAAMGADIVLLNLFDVECPVIHGLPRDTPPTEAVRTLKRLTGRVVGINLEPVDDRYAEDLGESAALPDGRLATAANAVRAADMGVDLVVLTGNPGAGVSNATIAASLRTLRAAVGDRVVLVAGKMHAAGVLAEGATDLLTTDDIDEFSAAGADIVLLPAPGTVPGITLDIAHELVSHAHRLGALTMTAVGTSQEGADEGTIRQLAVTAKMTGTDLHHLGDAGYGGAALPENIMAYSIAIRGRRHTYVRMARSIAR